MLEYKNPIKEELLYLCSTCKEKILNLTIVCVRFSSLKLGNNDRYSHIQIIICILTLLLQAIYENDHKNYKKIKITLAKNYINYIFSLKNYFSNNILI